MELVRLGAVTELLHLASLIHDDVVDRSAVRRGQPSVHGLVGPDMALLAGTALVVLVGQEAADLGPVTARAVSACAATLALGQLMDVERAYDTEFPVDDYVTMVTKKTSALFVLCCVLGAGCGDADRAFVTALTVFATELGVAFQIQDDCKDFASDGTGKAQASDQPSSVTSSPRATRPYGPTTPRCLVTILCGLHRAS